jgi:DNA-binding beta-propeller fold protein YncE
MGEALTRNQGYLPVAGNSGLTVFRVSDPEHGLSAPAGSLTGSGKHAVQVAVSPDDRFAFVSLQYSRHVAVFNLATPTRDSGRGTPSVAGPRKAETSPVSALLARVTVGQRPLGLILVKGGSQLIVTDSNRDNVSGGAATLAVIDVPRALAGKPSPTGFPPAGSTPRKFAPEPGGGTLLVADTGAGLLQADSTGQLP